jgi:hypothetical protein
MSGDRFVPRSNHQLKPKVPGPDSTRASRQVRSASIHVVPSSKAREERRPQRSPQVWIDFAVSAMWLVPTIGVIAYFLGLMVALAIVAAIVAVLGLLLNSTVDL